MSGIWQVIAASLPFRSSEHAKPAEQPASAILMRGQGGGQGDPSELRSEESKSDRGSEGGKGGGGGTEAARRGGGAVESKGSASAGGGHGF